MGGNMELWASVLVMFVGSICFANVLPTLQFYVAREEGSKLFLGAVTSAYAVGQICTAPLLGAWGDRRNSREAIAFGMVLLVVGNLSYSLAYLQPNPVMGRWILLISRFIVGCGSANVVVCQGHIAQNTTMAEKGKWMTMGSLAQALGFIVGPAMALLNRFMHFNYWEIKADEETLPGFVSAFMAFANLLFVMWVFRDRSKKVGPGYEPLASHDAAEEDPAKEDPDSEPLPCSFWLALGVLCLLNFVCLCTFTVFESMMTSFTEDTWGWGETPNYYCFVASAFICVFGFMLLLVFQKIFPDRVNLMFAMVMMAAGYGAIIDYSGTMPEWRLYITVLLGSIGYPWGITLVLTIFSKLLGKRKQGSKLGCLTAAGAMSRVVGPFTAGAIYQEPSLGPAVMWTTLVALIIMGLGLVIVAFPLLQPAAEAPETLKRRGSYNPPGGESLPHRKMSTDVPAV